MLWYDGRRIMLEAAGMPDPGADATGLVLSLAAVFAIWGYVKWRERRD